MEECKNYLRKAKAGQWTISIDDLMQQFNLTGAQVRQCIKEIYGF